jgi:hypothetical protein
MQWPPFLAGGPMVIDLRRFASADYRSDSWMATHLQRIGEGKGICFTLFSKGEMKCSA